MATAKVIHFNDTEQVDGIRSMRNEEFASLFPGVKGKKYDGYSRFVGKNVDGRTVPVTRIIYYKKNPSLHKCDARCQSAKGRNCECSCGGKYHGAGG